MDELPRAGNVHGDITVAAVMSTPPVAIEAGASLVAARHLLAQHGFHHLLVTDRGQLVAVLSERDLLRALSPFLGTIVEQPRDGHTLRRPVFQLATYHPVTVSPHASVFEAAALLLDHAISCLPVCDEGGRAVGIVTSNDLLRGMLACSLPAPHTLADVA